MKFLVLTLLFSMMSAHAAKSCHVAELNLPGNITESQRLEIIRLLELKGFEFGQSSSKDDLVVDLTSEKTYRYKSIQCQQVSNETESGAAKAYDFIFGGCERDVKRDKKKARKRAEKEGLSFEITEKHIAIHDKIFSFSHGSAKLTADGLSELSLEDVNVLLDKVDDCRN